MNVTIFQEHNNIEPYFWTKDEILSLSDNLNSNEDRYFTINDVHYKWKYISERSFTNFSIELDKGINIIVIHSYRLGIEFISFLKNLQSENNKDKKVFIVLAKLIEDYWGCRDFRDNDKLLKEISKIENVRVLWDVALYKLNNFIFSPKVQLQSYFITNILDSEVYLYGRDVFKKYPKEYRIGFHINKLSKGVRYEIAKKLFGYNNKNLFYTINSNCPYNKKEDLNKYTNYKPETFEIILHDRYGGTGTTPLWYTKQFFEFGVKSEMEIVYETSTYTDNIISELWLVKWNEKTIKHLYLGKPFIHCDPIAHRLMYENEMIPYRSLYTDKLWDIYENWDINKKNDYTFVEAVIENIKWLSEMNEIEWSERIGEANRIAQINKNKVDHLIFNTSLMDIVKSDIY